MTDPGLGRSIVSGCALLETACRSRVTGPQSSSILRRPRDQDIHAGCIGSGAPATSCTQDSAGCREGLATVLPVFSSNVAMPTEAPETIRRVWSLSFPQRRNPALHLSKTYRNVREMRR